METRPPKVLPLISLNPSPKSDLHSKIQLMKFAKKQNCFTLIELLVVVAIIGILAAFVTPSLTKARAKARDIRRVADLRSLSLALEMYYSDNNHYPIWESDCVDLETGDPLDNPLINGADGSPAFFTPKYISKAPKDPLPNKYCYFYKSDNVGSKYKLAAHLELDQEKSEDDGGTEPGFYEIYSFGYGEQIDLDDTLLAQAMPGYVAPVVISTRAIGGVTVPVTGKSPSLAVLPTTEYTAEITSWSPGDDPFNIAIVYTATITLAPKPGYTLTGVSANFFTVDGATTVTNPAGSGVVTAVFPETAMVYALRDPGPAGGHVFYITDGGLHGMEAAPESTESGTKDWGWDCDPRLIGTDETAVGTGAQNTAVFIATCDDSSAPAWRCQNLDLNGYHDWFLPSKDELMLMCTELVQHGNVGGFAQYAYWSSSEGDTSHAWDVYTNYPEMADCSDNHNDWKYFSHRTRCARAF